MDVRAQNRPTAANIPASRSSPSVRPSSSLPPRGTPGILKTVLISVGIIAGLVFIACCVLFFSSKLTSSESAIKKDGYQALFLTNNQIYFGHLKNIDGKYVQITDVYYLQVQQGVQSQKDQAESSQQASLSKLGSEIHGPEDTMHVARDQVLFWENLKDDGKVVQAIKEHQKNNSK